MLDSLFSDAFALIQQIMFGELCLLFRVDFVSLRLEQMEVYLHCTWLE